MIVTLTPNPSVDRTIEVPQLVRGAVIRATSSRVDPGGKGVNVARAVVANGGKAVAVLPGGGSEGLQMDALLDREGIEHVIVPIAGACRANVTVIEPDGTTTKLNEQGPTLTPDEVGALVAATLDAARSRADWVVCSGSLPLGVSGDFYADLVTALRAEGLRIAVDSSGDALAAALAARPDLVKPNREELAEVTGRTIRTLGEAAAAAQQLRELGPAIVLASLGADGALLVDRTGEVHFGQSHLDVVRSTVAAGDSMLAGFLHAGGEGRSALAAALAWGAGAASLPGTAMPGPDDVARIDVRLHDHLEQDQVLRERS